MDEILPFRWENAVELITRSNHITLMRRRKVFYNKVNFELVSSKYFFYQPHPARSFSYSFFSIAKIKIK